MRDLQLFIFMGTKPGHWSAKKPASGQIKRLKFKLTTGTEGRVYTMGATRSSNKAKAARVARELMKSFDIGDLYELVSEHLDYPADTARLYAAVDPRYCSLEKERFKLFHILENAVKTEEEKRALNMYSDNWVEQCSIREMGWFYLGYAAALRFFGSSPAIKLIEGGRKDELKPAPIKSEFKL